MTIDSVTLRSGSREASLTLVRTGPPERDGSVSVRVVLAGQLAADVPAVWFFPDALAAFAHDLARFERERSGSASFASLGAGVSAPPSEFALALDSTPGGHATAAVSLFLPVPSRSGPLAQEMTARFDVDGGDLPGFVAGWRATFPDQAPPRPQNRPL